MQEHKADLRELIESLLSLTNNPIALLLSELQKQDNGMRIGEFISRYEGLKDGELLGILSSMFGMTFSAGRATCSNGVGSSLSGLMMNLYLAFAEPGVKQDLLQYLGISEIPSPEVLYWRQRLGLLTRSELATVGAFVRLGASEDASAKRIEEISAEARRIDPGIEINSSTLAALTSKMPIVKDTDKYHLSVEPWNAFVEAVATLAS